MLEGLEEDFQEGTTMMVRDQLTEFAKLIIFEFCCGLRAEKIVKLDVASFLKYLEVGVDRDKCQQVVVPFVGDSKQRWEKDMT